MAELAAITLAAKTAKRALTALFMQERRSLGVNARPSQVIDSESVSREVGDLNVGSTQTSAHFLSVRAPAASIDSSLDRGHPAHRNDFILQAETGPSTY
jgi:hypothetical protein